MKNLNYSKQKVTILTALTNLIAEQTESVRANTDLNIILFNAKIRVLSSRLNFINANVIILSLNMFSKKLNNQNISLY
jgi:hypothetical protein